MDDRYDLGMRWEAAIFMRAHEVSTGDFLGETIVFDPSAGNDFMDWGDPKKPGRRVLAASGFPLADSTRCSDPATLAKLDAFYKRQHEASRAAWALRNMDRSETDPQGNIRQRPKSGPYPHRSHQSRCKRAYATTRLRKQAPRLLNRIAHKKARHSHAGPFLYITYQ
jgi:hypothetical protein